MRRFEPSDIDEINRWYAARGCAPVASEELPALGFVEPGVAVGFLWRGECGVSIVTGFVSNPEASSEQRRDAFAAISDAITEAAQPKPGEPPARLLLLTQDPSIAQRARDRGCALIPHDVLALTLRG